MRSKCWSWIVAGFASFIIATGSAPVAAQPAAGPPAGGVPEDDPNPFADDRIVTYVRASRAFWAYFRDYYFSGRTLSGLWRSYRRYLDALGRYQLARIRYDRWEQRRAAVIGRVVGSPIGPDRWPPAGDGLAGARVRLVGGGRRFSTTTAGDGSFSFHRLQRNTPYRYRITLAGYRPALGTLVAGDASVEEIIVLQSDFPILRPLAATTTAPDAAPGSAPPDAFVRAAGPSGTPTGGSAEETPLTGSSLDAPFP